MKKSIVFLLIVMTTLASWAQQKDKVLFTINGEPTYVAEFAKVYKKNLDIIEEKDQKDIDEYFELFVEYKLKLQEAERLKLHENDSYIKELAGYRKQLAKNYLTDDDVTEQLVREAYDRLQKEIKASHILIRLDENAAPKDTLAAYTKIMKLREKIIAGADFGEVAVQSSEDPSAKGNQNVPGNKGDLGYFSAFRMVYPFESAAFNTAVGEVSMPVRTQFGYHLIKVEDTRKNAGEISVAHILLIDKNDEGSAEKNKEKIQDIYSQIQAGSDFAQLAKRFSDDRSSAVKGGELQKFGRGRLRSKIFEDKAFSLDEKGQISEPFKSEFGWHIVKLIKKHESKTFEEEKSRLEQRIKRDNRAQAINTSVLKKIRQLYKISEAENARNDFYKTAASANFFTRSWQIPVDSNWLSKKLLTINDTTFTYRDFAQHIYTSKARVVSRNAEPKSFINKQLNDYVNGKLLAYYEADLENVNEDFAAIYGEYRDGLLLFDLMKNEIWEKAKNDTLGLEQFFADNKENYKWKQRFDGIIASCTQKEAAKTVQTMLEANSSPEAIKKAVNKDAKINVIFSTGKFENDHRNLPKDFKIKKGVSDVMKDGTSNYVVVKVTEIIPESYKELEEIKGKVISDYQVFLEKQWMQQLKNTYVVDINKRNRKKLEKLIK